VLPPTRIRFILPFTVKVINPITRRFVGFVPGFAMLTHVGRKSGRMYHTPINVFQRGDHYVFALTYGSDVQWLKNIFAAGSVEMRTRGRDIRLVEPELIIDPELRLMPWFLRIPGKLNRVTEFLRMRAEGTD
jgi:deazaflavin-dependent oxidoreductase (nitroreductase family)